MFSKISRLYSLFKLYGFHAFLLVINPILGREIWIKLHGRKVWLNFDNATYYHLIHSVGKVEKLVGAIPKKLSGAIIDGGANHGLFSIMVAQKMPDARVLALEPYQKILPILRKNTAGTNVTIIEKALSPNDGEVVFYAAPSSDQVGSVIRDNVEEFIHDGAAIQETKVPATTLASLVQREGITKIAVMKLDIQGAEFSILEAADSVLAITDCLLLEVMLIEQTAIDLLIKVKKFFPYHKVLNQLPYGADIIFSKKPLIE